MGGSLVPHGGQNPIEAVKLGAAILHGPHVCNFADIYDALDRRGARAGADGGKLAVQLGRLAQRSAAERTAWSAAAAQVVDGSAARSIARWPRSSPIFCSCGSNGGAADA